MIKKGRKLSKFREKNQIILIHITKLLEEEPLEQLILDYNLKKLPFAIAFRLKMKL